MTERNRSLRITEIFLSLQGESNLVGLPTVFVRLTGCPLRCQYCDSEYAFHGGSQYAIDEIVAEVAALAGFVLPAENPWLSLVYIACSPSSVIANGRYRWKPVGLWMWRW